MLLPVPATPAEHKQSNLSATGLHREQARDSDTADEVSGGEGGPDQQPSQRESYQQCHSAAVGRTRGVGINEMLHYCMMPLGNHAD